MRSRWTGLATATNEFRGSNNVWFIGLSALLPSVAWLSSQINMMARWFQKLSSCVEKRQYLLLRMLQKSGNFPLLEIIWPNAFCKLNKGTQIVGLCWLMKPGHVINEGNSEFWLVRPGSHAQNEPSVTWLARPESRAHKGNKVLWMAGPESNVSPLMLGVEANLLDWALGNIIPKGNSQDLPGERGTGDRQTLSVTLGV